MKTASIPEDTCLVASISLMQHSAELVNVRAWSAALRACKHANILIKDLADAPGKQEIVETLDSLIAKIEKLRLEEV